MRTGNQQKTAQTLLPLSDIPAGATVRIEQVGDCPKMRSRLLAMGLTPGCTATVDSCGCGQCCLCVRGYCLALGHGMAEKILVRVMERPPLVDTAPRMADPPSCREERPLPRRRRRRW